MFFSPLAFTITLPELLVEVDPSSLWVEGIGKGARRVSMSIINGDSDALLSGSLDMALCDLGVLATEISQIKAVAKAAITAQAMGHSANQAAKTATGVLHLPVCTSMSPFGEANCRDGLGDWQPSTRFEVQSVA